MKIEQIKTSELVPYANNAKLHSDEQVKKIAASIKEFKFNNPVLIDKDNGIIAGHGRVLAAELLKLKEVPCIRLGHLTEAQKKAYILADNRLGDIGGGWNEELLKIELEGLKELDFNIDLTGFDDSFLSFVEEPTEGLIEDDEIPEVAEPKVKLGDVWQLGDHRLLCGDCTDRHNVERLMNGKKADLVFTDPPYGVSYADKNAFLNAADKGNRIQAEIANDHLSVEETSEFIFKAFCNIKESLADRSSYYITSPQGGELLLMMMMTMQKAGIPHRHMLIWVKNNHVLGRADYNYKHEPILFGWAKVHDFYGNGAHKFSTWEIPKPHSSKLHPTMKPVELVVNAALNSSRLNDIVLDVFGGSGSTLIACEKLNRTCYMMELSPEYCDVIINRWEKFTGETAIKC